MDWKARLKEKTVLLSDGAWGTELAKRGLAPGDPPELWNAERAADVEAVARAYVEAGADVILTNTFGGSAFKLARLGLADRAAELSRVGVELSKRAADGRALVFASVGPTGELMAPLGLKSEEEFVACFAEQIAACAEGGADGIVVETMADLGEARAALRAARQVCSLPVVVSMTFDKGPAGFATMMGVKPARAAAELDAAGADLIGSNCGSGMEHMIEVARLLRAATQRPLWLKSNAGVPELIGGKTVFRQTPADMAAGVRALIEAGANVIGGCCGSTPEHIRALAAAIDEHRPLARSVGAAVLAAL